MMKILKRGSNVLKRRTHLPPSISLPVPLIDSRHWKTNVRVCDDGDADASAGGRSPSSTPDHTEWRSGCQTHALQSKPAIADLVYGGDESGLRMRRNDQVAGHAARNERPFGLFSGRASADLTVRCFSIPTPPSLTSHEYRHEYSSESPPQTPPGFSSREIMHTK